MLPPGPGSNPNAPAEAPLLIRTLKRLVPGAGQSAAPPPPDEQPSAEPSGAELLEELRRSEERFRLALGSTSLVVFEQDRDLRMRWRYPTPPDFYERIYGRTDEELLPNEEGAALAAIKRRVIETGQGVREEVRVTFPDGVRWWEIMIEPRRDSSGAVIGIAGTALNITERKRAEQRAEAERNLLRQVLDQMPDGVIIVEAETGRVILRNAAGPQIARRPVKDDGELLVDYRGFRGYRPDGSVYQPEEWPLSRALRKGEVVQGEEMAFDRGDGVRGTLRASAAPILDARGKPIAAVTVYQDVTERIRAEEFATFLASASEVLASSLDYRATLATVAKLVVPRIADWCAVDILRDDGTLDRVAVAHVNPEKVRYAHELEERYPIDMEAATGVPQVLRSGRPEHVPVIADEMLAAAAKDPEHLRIMRELGLRSYMGVPLVVRGRTLGAVTFVTAESGRVYTEADLAQAMDLARRAAMAVENARLYQTAREELAERTRVEADLRRSEERFRAAFKQSPLAKQLFRPDGLCIDANPAWAALWNASANDFVGYNILNDPQLEARGIMPEIRRAFRGEIVHIDRVRYDPAEIGKPGRPRYVKVSLSPIKNDAGELSEVVLVLEDVTGEVEAEAALRESEERLRTATEAGRVGTWEWDIAADRVVWSPQTYEIHRLPMTGAPVTVEDWARIVHPDDKERVNEAVRRSLEEGEPYALEFRAIAGDGQVQWLWTRATVQRDAAGRPLRLIGATIDITDRKQVERELRESELRHRLVSRATSDVIWDWDIENDRVLWSDAVRGTLGWTPEELGESIQAWYERIHPEDKDRVVQAMHAALETGAETVSDEYRFRRKDESYATVLDRGFVARAADGHPVRMIGSLLDVTERRRSEEALAEAYQRLNSVLSAITEGYIALDNQFRFIALNPAAQRMVFSNRSVGEVLGQHYFDLYPQSRGGEFQRQYQRAIAEQVDVHFEARSPITGRWFETHAYPRKWGLEIYMRDITERMQAQEEMQRQARDLARSNQELQDFAYVASHDLKEPLRGISTYATILAEDYAGKLDEAGADKIETISRLAKRMYGLLDALLEYSRIGRSDAGHDDVDTGRVVADAIDSLRTRLAEVQVEVAQGLPRIPCDRIGVLQVFTNLISNAVKYNTSSLKRVEIGCRERDGQTAFFVRDNGIGIAPQHHERVFSMFKRLHKREEYGGGMGAGLAIVKKVVEHHGGRVWIESDAGRGCTFWFTLAPARMRSVVLEEARPPQSAATSAGTPSAASESVISER